MAEIKFNEEDYKKIFFQMRAQFATSKKVKEAKEPIDFVNVVIDEAREFLSKNCGLKEYGLLDPISTSNSNCILAYFIIEGDNKPEVYLDLTKKFTVAVLDSSMVDLEGAFEKHPY